MFDWENEKVEGMKNIQRKEKIFFVFFLSFVFGKNDREVEGWKMNKIFFCWL